MNNNYDFLFKLEEELTTTATRSNVARISDLLDDSFFEFGSSGKLLTRNDILELLPKEVGLTMRAHDFSATELSPDIVLITFKTEASQNGVTKKALRSSIWKKRGETWKMMFHQGTHCPE